MIASGWTEPAVAAGVEEWRRGREADPTLAPRGVPDISVVRGYSLDDIRYNCVGLQSPEQAWETKKALLHHLLGIVIGGAFVALTLAHGGSLVTIVALIITGACVVRAVLYFQDILVGAVSQVDGDIWTELRRDSDGFEEFFVYIDDLRLEVTKQAYEVLTAGGPYRIYYLPKAKRAVGGQVLPTWRPLPRPAPRKRSWWSGIRIEV